jgi:general secretion pathway protein G
MRPMTKVARRGFTLIELLLVLVILSVLAALVVPKFVGRGEESKIKAAAVDIHSIGTALEAFEVDNGRFPSDSEGLAALVSAPPDCPNWHQILPKLPVDPWNQPYQYHFPGQHNPQGYDLWSLGPDHSGNNDLLNNWSVNKH